jgi:hypothetical protein
MHSSSNRRIEWCHQELACFLERAQRLLAIDGREVIEELLQGMAVL